MIGQRIVHGWLAFRIGGVCLLMAGCAAPQPRTAEFVITPELAAAVSTNAQNVVAASANALNVAAAKVIAREKPCEQERLLAERAKDSVIAIDARGRYTPVVYKLPMCPGEEVSQPAPSLVPCSLVVDPKITDPQPRCVEWHAYDNIISKLLKGPENKLPNPPQDKLSKPIYHLLVFVHGGLNPEQDRLRRAFVDTNLILDEARDKIKLGDTTGRLRNNEVWYPLFVTWPSDGLESYQDHRIHYNQGDYNSDFKRWTSWLYFPIDAVEAIVRAPAAYLEGFSWVDLGETPEVTKVAEIGCQQRRSNAFACEHEDPNELAIWKEFAKEKEAPYWHPIGFAGRSVTIPAVDVAGQPAWDAMLSRTRMLMRRPFNVDDFAAADGTLDGKADLWHLFDAIQELPKEKQPPITLIGHSMGAIVVNEILQNFPELCYRSIVFMGAAASVRDTIAALDRAARAQSCNDLWFYNLSLHERAEANEVGAFGTVAKGSLLEWVDRMYTTPATFADRTVGKWINAVMATDDFVALEGQVHLSFKRFGLDCNDPLNHGDFDDNEQRRGCAEPGTPYWHPAFWTVAPAPPQD